VQAPDGLLAEEYVPAPCIELSLPYPPTTNQLYATYRGRRILSKKGREYKAEVEGIFRAKKLRMLDGTIKVSIFVHRKRKAGDLDNRFKVLLDSLTGLAWNDDSQIIELHGFLLTARHEPFADVYVERWTEEDAKRTGYVG